MILVLVLGIDLYPNHEDIIMNASIKKRKTSDDILYRIFTAIQRKGINRTTLYEYVGLPANAFSVWAKRKTIPRADVLLCIAEYLDVSIQWLLTGEDENGLTEDELQLVECYRSMNISARTIARGQMLILAKRYE